jgi:hypothetical protein
MQMRKSLRQVAALVLIGSLAGCASIGALFGKGESATRYLADIACVTAVAKAYGEIAGDPSVNGAVTVQGVLAKIAEYGTSTMPADVVAACSESFKYADADLAGLIAQIKGAPAQPTTDAPPKTKGVPKLASKPSAPPKTVQPVVIPLKK